MGLWQPEVVVLRALGLGDFLTAVPALRAISRAFPEHRRLLAAPSWLAPLLGLLVEDGRPCLHGVLDTEGLLDHTVLRDRRPDVAVNLHGRGPASHWLLLAARPRRMVAFRHGGVEASAEMPLWRAEEHEVDRWCRLITESGMRAEPAELAIRRPGVAVPAWTHGATLLHPGAASAARRWPAERWVAVAAAERAAGREVVLTGSGSEADLARRIASDAGLEERAVVAGRTDVAELAALVAAAGRVVCGDTGVGHLATALGVPSVLLFGPTPPRHWGPRGADRRHLVLWRGSEGDPHAGRVDPGLLEIDTSAVTAALARLPATA